MRVAAELPRAALLALRPRRAPRPGRALRGPLRGRLLGARRVAAPGPMAVVEARRADVVFVPQSIQLGLNEVCALQGEHATGLERTGHRNLQSTDLREVRQLLPRPGGL